MSIKWRSTSVHRKLLNVIWGFVNDLPAEEYLQKKTTEHIQRQLHQIKLAFSMIIH